MMTRDPEHQADSDRDQDDREAAGLGELASQLAGQARRRLDGFAERTKPAGGRERRQARQTPLDQTEERVVDQREDEAVDRQIEGSARSRDRERRLDPQRDDAREG